MVRSKQRKLLAKPRSKDNYLVGFGDLTSSKLGVDLTEDEWIIVKKQKVNILISPVLDAKKSIMPDSEPSQQQNVAEKGDGKLTELPTMSCPVDEHENSLFLKQRKGIEVAETMSPARPMSPKPIPRQDFRMKSTKPGQNVTFVSDRRLGVRVPSPLSALKHPRLLHGPISFLDKSVSLNQRLRVSNLERKLQRAGGLSQWLASLGLRQFVRLFQGRRIGKFQLVNLTMKKLKDMGADAVGPRRKLMHALDCLCQPYCFQSL